MLTALYLLLLRSTPSSYSVHLRIILGCSPLSTYCYSGVLQVHTQYIPGSSWDTHHSLPTATPEYSKFILTTLCLLLLRSIFHIHTQYISGSSWDAHNSLPTATPEYSKFILSTSQDHPGILTPYIYKFTTGQHTNSGGSLVKDPGIIPGLANMSEYWPAH